MFAGGPANNMNPNGPGHSSSDWYPCISEGTLPMDSWVKCAVRLIETPWFGIVAESNVIAIAAIDLVGCA